MNAVAILKFIENTVASKHYEVVIVAIYAEGEDVGIGHNYTLVAIQFL